jgi:hypothetical protein
MKRILSLIALTPALLFGAQSYDISPGLDTTGLTSVTAAQLMQLVNRAVIATNKGAIVFSASTPDVANNPRFKQWLWLDSSANPPSIKVYNTNSATWVAQPITAGSVGTAELADNAVTNAKLTNNSVNSAQIINGAIASEDIANESITSAHLFQPAVSNMHVATRTLEGGYSGVIALATITHTNLALGTIQSANLAAQSITSNYLAAGQVFAAHIAPTNITADALRTDAVTTDKLTNSAVTAAKIADGVITTNKLASAAHQQLIKAWGIVNSSGTLVAGYGATVGTTATGVYVVTPTVAPGTTNYAAVVSVLDSSGAAINVATNALSNFAVHTRNTSFVLADRAFVFHLIY